MTEDSLFPGKERLWQAIRWLGEQKGRDLALIEEACKRFDLSPQDEEFLLHEWHQQQETGKKR
jgi:hypothetical protein